MIHFRSNARWVLLLAWFLCANLFRHSGMAFNQGQGWPSWLCPLLAPLKEWMVYNYFHTQRNLLKHVMKSWTLNFQSSRRRLCEWILNIFNLSWPFGASASLLLEVKRLQSKERSSRGVAFESCSEKASRYIVLWIRTTIFFFLLHRCIEDKKRLSPSWNLSCLLCEYLYLEGKLTSIKYQTLP